MNVRRSLNRSILKHSRRCASSYLMLIVLAAPNMTLAEPVIRSMEGGGATVKHGAELAIQGAGFGEKPDAEPVLVDYVDNAFENGKENRVYSSYEDGKVIEVSSDNPDSLWSVSASDLPVRYDTKSQSRHPHDNARYRLYGHNVWLGRPVAYGGLNGWDTPTNNSQLYLSWWVKVDYNSLYYWRINPSSISGEFRPDEEVLVGGELGGQFIGRDEEGLLNFVLNGHVNANKLKGVQLVGRASGAKAQFPNDFRGGDGYGYEPPGTKTLRIWDDPKSKGIRTSLSHTDYFVSAYAGSEYSSNRIYQKRNMVPDVWHHFEVELDVEKGTFKSWFNGELGGVAKFDPRAAYRQAYSPTIALIGNNAKQDHLQNMYISEIYMDKSIQRVVIGDAPDYGDLTHYELQVPIRWNDKEIEFSVNLGSLDPSRALYLYVFDENGVPNPQGFALCGSGDCLSPPEPIKLQVD